jgi:hypothetical protein
MWVYIGDRNDVVFDYTRTHSRDGPANFLGSYRGYLQADAHSSYDGVYCGGDVIEVACWAHARRYFYDAQDSDRPRAEAMLAQIRRLYSVERRAKAYGLKDDSKGEDKLRRWRQRYSTRRLDRIRVILDAWSLEALPMSPLGKAITYALNNWAALKRYTEAGFLDIDNNLSERTIRDLVIGRRNWLFAGSQEAAARAATIFSVVASCKLHDIDPFTYLRDVLTRLPDHPAERVDELTPRKWLERRQADRQGDRDADVGSQPTAS